MQTRRSKAKISEAAALEAEPEPVPVQKAQPKPKLTSKSKSKPEPKNQPKVKPPPKSKKHTPTPKQKEPSPEPGLPTPEPEPKTKRMTNKRKAKATDEEKKLEVSSKKIKLIDIDFTVNDSNDKVVEDLRKCQKDKPVDQQTSMNSAIVDHVALEGLDGLTLKRLFNLLDALFPNFNIKNNISCQNYIWSILRSHLGFTIKAYFNPHIQTNNSSASESRKDDANSQEDQKVEFDPTVTRVIFDKPFKLPQQTVSRIVKVDSMVYPVQDGPIRGSCKNYTTRQDITEEVIDKFNDLGPRGSLCALEQEYSLDRIYLVASQSIRDKTLLPSWSDPNVELKLREYCVLELIGKTRTLGCVFPNNKALGRYRIMLVKKKFITEYQETASSPIEHNLKSFSYTRKWPGFIQQQYRSRRKSDYCKRAITCDVTDLKDSDDDNNDNASSSSDDEDEDDENQNSIDKQSKVTLSKICCNPWIMKPRESILTVIYKTIARAENGLTQLDLRRILNLPKFHVRNHLKNLISIQMIWSEPVTIDNPFRRYKVAYFTRKKKRRDALTGVMAKWDERDVKAKKFLGHKRSSFSQAEDSLLILCRIASILIEPNQPKHSWCGINKRIIRDILHEEMVESLDKTSDACLRRIKYLKRLKNNVMSINELTAELREDGDIRELLEHKRIESIKKGKKMRKLFRSVLKTIRVKIPNLLDDGLNSSRVISNAIEFRPPALAGLQSSSIKPLAISEGVSGRPALDNQRNGEHAERFVEVKSHKDLLDKYLIEDCQTVAPSAASRRTPTFDPSRGDSKQNNVALVTMAYILSNAFNQQPDQRLAQSSPNHHERQLTTRKIQQNILDRFYSSYQEKLISSVLGKLSKRSLLTRKCSAEGTGGGKLTAAATGTITTSYASKFSSSIKLNQSVLFSLNRHNSTSLIQLAESIDEVYKIDLSESNQMSTFALLTSLYSSSAFNLDLKLKIPEDVVKGIDRESVNFSTDCLIVRPCNVSFQCDNELKLIAKGTLQSFFEKHQSHPRAAASPIRSVEAAAATTTKSSPSSTNSVRENWLVKSFKIDPEKEIDVLASARAAAVELMRKEGTKRDKKSVNHDRLASLQFENSVEFTARLWKRVDGEIERKTLFKLMESLLSWMIVFPGITLKQLKLEFNHLMPVEHLIELLELMESLKLINFKDQSRECSYFKKKPRLFGYGDANDKEQTDDRYKFYEAQENAFAQYCQLIKEI